MWLIRFLGSSVVPKISRVDLIESVLVFKKEILKQMLQQMTHYLITLQVTARLKPEQTSVVSILLEVIVFPVGFQLLH